MLTISQSTEKTCQKRQHGDLKEVKQLYEQLLKSDPGNHDMLHSLGVIAYQEGKYNEAVELISKAIQKDDCVAKYHNTLGIILEALGRFQEAIHAYQKAVTIRADYAEAYHNMAIALQSMGRYEAAVEMCTEAILHDPNLARAYNTKAFSLEKQKLYSDAIENYRQALQLDPNLVEAYNHLGMLLNAQGETDEAIKIFRCALQYDPYYAEVYNNLGIALKEQEQFSEAMANFVEAIQLDPQFAEAYYNLANSLRDEGRCVEAINNYNKAIDLNPDYAQAHWNLSLTNLLSGNYLEGWKGYRWRRNADLKILTDYHRNGKSRWDGSSFENRTLLIHYEQGLGDNIQFVRYLPMVKARGGTVVYETLKPLIGLLQGFPGVDEIMEYRKDEQLSLHYDVYSSLMDMPNIFGTTVETIPAGVPYIHADSSKVEHWRKKLSGDDLKVGIVWAGSPEHGNDRYRSCSLKCFAPLSEIDGVQLYGLQKGRAAGQMDEYAETIKVTNISKDFNDLTDTAAAIENLNLVISVDTCVLHLSGAMEKATWALLPYAPEWRWMLYRKDSPWYPTMRLFRQVNWNDWDTVFQCVAEELEIMVKRNRG